MIRPPGGRRRFLGLLAAVASLAVVAGAFSAARPASAAILDAFDPADIISDGVMFNPSTMTTADIDRFLAAQQPTCAPGATCLKSLRIDTPTIGANPMCAATTGAADQSVAQVIKAVANACRVNPQVMLVMLQKEQTLITGRRPYSGESVSLIYRKATGLGCPDTAACDPAKYGLFNQLYGVAYWLVRYTMPPGTGPGTGYSSQYTWFPVGRPSGVLYNPSAACGSGAVTIRNKATASLYYYTPYQPNTAALAAGWGLGNSCSAYGNRNFFLYFTTWFGSTHYTVTGPIATYWKAQKRGKGVFGDPIGPATAAPANGGGTFQRFAGGTVYTSKAGTFGVRGGILAKYAAGGGPTGTLGWPVGVLAKRTAGGGGTAQGFQHGAVYASSTGTWTVAGGVYARYRREHQQDGALSWPTADAVTSDASGGGSRQSFRKGVLAATPAGSALVTGAVLAKWRQRGLEASSMGWPTGEAATVKAHGVTGTVQRFQRGAVLTPAGTVFTVTGDLWRTYLHHRGPAGSLGWPRAVATRSAANGGGWSQRFTGGTIYWSAASGAHAMAGPELQLYNRRGGTSGTLGWPGTRTRDRAGDGGWVTPFTNGRVYTSKSGTFAVLGDILQRYLAKKGPEGALGWPRSAATTSEGVTTQLFEHGRITWSPDDGAKASGA